MMLRSVLAAIFLAPLSAFATDLTLTWDVITTYTQDGVTKPLPAGKVTYKVYNSRTTDPTTLVEKVRNNAAEETVEVRKNVAVGQQCYAVQAIFTPTVPDPQWSPSAITTPVCITVSTTAPGPVVLDAPKNLTITK